MSGHGHCAEEVVVLGKCAQMRCVQIMAKEHVYKVLKGEVEKARVAAKKRSAPKAEAKVRARAPNDEKEDEEETAEPPNKKAKAKAAPTAKGKARSKAKATPK